MLTKKELQGLLVALEEGGVTRIDMRPDSVDASARLQEVCFEKGYRWAASRSSATENAPLYMASKVLSAYPLDRILRHSVSIDDMYADEAIHIESMADMDSRMTLVTGGTITGLPWTHVVLLYATDINDRRSKNVNADGSL